jgi:hypothetical protein
LHAHARPSLGTHTPSHWVRFGPRNRALDRACMRACMRGDVQQAARTTIGGPRFRQAFQKMQAVRPLQQDRQLAHGDEDGQKRLGQRWRGPVPRQGTRASSQSKCQGLSEGLAGGSARISFPSRSDSRPSSLATARKPGSDDGGEGKALAENGDFPGEPALRPAAGCGFRLGHIHCPARLRPGRSGPGRKRPPEPSAGWGRGRGLLGGAELAGGAAGGLLGQLAGRSIAVLSGVDRAPKYPSGRTLGSTGIGVFYPGGLAEVRPAHFWARGEAGPFLGSNRANRANPELQKWGCRWAWACR